MTDFPKEVREIRQQIKDATQGSYQTAGIQIDLLGKALLRLCDLLGEVTDAPPEYAHGTIAAQPEPAPVNDLIRSTTPTETEHAGGERVAAEDTR